MIIDLSHPIGEFTYPGLPPELRSVVGIDPLNIDNPGDPERPALRGLLGAGIPIIEHLTNLALVPHGARLTALPAPVSGMASFPVRAVVVCPG
ncbi:MAG: hypothetical protein ACTHJW_09985 [Streptosporangiaceae bacterium]